MFDAFNHAAHRRAVLQRTGTVDVAQTSAPRWSRRPGFPPADGWQPGVWRTALASTFGAAAFFALVRLGFDFLLGHNSSGLFLVFFSLPSTRLRGGQDFADSVAARFATMRGLAGLQRIEGRPHHVVRVGSADGLGNHVGNAQCFEYGAHRAAGDDTGTGRCGAQVNFARAETAAIS